MERLGLPSKWISAALALYKGSLRRALVLRQRGPSIPLCSLSSRGARWPPYLSLFISDAFSFFLNRLDAGIRGLVVPHVGKDLLDSMYAYVAFGGMLDVRQSLHKKHEGNGERVPLVG